MNSLKEDYIKTKLDVYNEATIVGYFKRMLPFEEQLGKDLCNFTLMEILNVYSQSAYKSIYTLQMVNSVFKEYTNYCMNNNIVIDNQNHYSEIRINHLRSCINEIQQEQLYISREELLLLLDKLKNDSDKFLVLAVYEGLGGKDYKEIEQLSIWDIDFDKRTMSTCLGRTIHVSNRLLQLAEMSHNEEVYDAVIGDRSRRLLASEKIIKPYVTQTSDTEYRGGRRLYKRFKNIFASLDMPEMTPKFLRDCGIIYLVRKYCKEYNVSPHDFLRNEKYRNLINIQYEKKLTYANVSAFEGKYKNLLESVL